MSKTKSYIVLHILVLLMSITGIFSKLAAQNEFMSLKFLIYYGGTLFILFIYAIFWQQILKTIPLVIAYSNKGIGLIWGMLFGTIFFNETITLKMILGAIIVFFGIMVVINSDK